ncbi:hypothetical protein QNA24_22445 [Rhodococcus qingshengii]|uniref:hypothetical protein n=1 Tax=Rhodococcus qingshengii TaxID=334542 RepID=UPI0024B9FAEC|nr:hypothetical protein [Rhodococcus qingshengii]MDJ0489138.1 hypothetical protein [Rhodococcus qingshengii]
MLRNPSRPLAVLLLLLIVPLTWAITKWTVDIALVTLMIVFAVAVSCITNYAIAAFTRMGRCSDERQDTYR